MKIGTKSNAINDLGKFDGSKMTIKVNGKQIYPQKRYAIVRVDRNCPFVVEDIEHKDCEKIFNCDEFWNDELCSKKCNYGDTKEQLIMKVVQAMLIRFKRIYKGKFITVEMARKQYLEVAKEIVEFLGVEE